MTQQFKFGDRVRYKDNENPVFGVVLEEANPGNGLITVQFIDNAEPELVGIDDLEHIPYPDTARLDWLIKTKHAILPGWCGDVYAESREEIDAAMQAQAAEAEAT